MRFELALCLMAAACSSGSDGGGPRGPEALEAEFDDVVAQSNACAVDDDCVIVASDCPLPCAVAVSADLQQAVEQKAAELVAEYRSDPNRDCGGYCQPGPTAVCADARCQVVYP